MKEKDPFSVDLGFKSFGERVRNERIERINQPAPLKFGVKYLDRALGGIFKNDLILLGAKTGAGKTALSTIAAIENAKAGKRVHYFALEAEPLEIERRMKYMALANLVFGSGDIEAKRRMNYMDWYLGRVEDIVEKFEATVDDFLSRAFASMQTFYRERDFTADSWEKTVLSIQDQTDLIILDHLHYVDSDDSNENRGYKMIVKKIRDVALDVGKPVLVVAHVRKGDRRVTQLVPSLEDFHGTSDVPKIATKAVMIAPAFDQSQKNKNVWPTYLHAAKCRPEGSRTRYMGCVDFNASTNTYAEQFDIYRLSHSGDSAELVVDVDHPQWAR